MLRKVTGLVAFALVVLMSASAPLSAQGKVEASFLVGWTFSDGVDVGDQPPILSQDGELFDRIDPDDSFKWGFMVGFNATPNVEVGFQYGRQPTTLQASGTTDREIGDLSVTTYHGYVAYNFLEAESKVRPYALFGMGATNFSSVDFVTSVTQQPRTIEGETQFSTTISAGVKFFASPNVGARFGVQWVPTYIKTDAGGWWCDPWFGCYVVGNSQYSSQWDLSGGVVFRF
ncbi:MAG TPA: outer membrane beta-barrel protein [Vicinamibacterales bacterium]|nr:outer membrane beta-barrel protein [Vicinamibacterales bacterium]